MELVTTAAPRHYTLRYGDMDGGRTLRCPIARASTTNATMCVPCTRQGLESTALTVVERIYTCYAICYVYICACNYYTCSGTAAVKQSHASAYRMHAADQNID